MPKLLENLQTKAIRLLPRTQSDPGKAPPPKPVTVVKAEADGLKRDCTAKRYSITFESAKSNCGKGPATVQ